MTMRRCWHGGLRGPLALVVLALVAGAFAVASAASAQASEAQSGTATAQPVDVVLTTFVSNGGQLDPDGFLTYGGTVFQGFTTGGNPAGYSLSEISVVPQQRAPDPEEVEEQSGPQSSVVLQRDGTGTDVEPEQPAPQASVEIWSQIGRRIKMPGEPLYRLISPPSVPLDEEVAFGAPPGTILTPNTTYYARIVDAIQVGWDMDREMDSGTADGWSLANGLMYQSEGANAYVTYVPNATISVRGVALLGRFNGQVQRTTEATAAKCKAAATMVNRCQTSW